MQKYEKASFNAEPIAWLLIGLWITLPNLASCPQTGDGGEFINSALGGGVLHPPGFPVQLWLGKLFVQIPFLPAAVSISLLSALGHIGMALCLWFALTLLGCSLVSRTVGVAAAVLFPPVWILGVQPEVFSLANFFIAAILAQTAYLTVFPKARMHQSQVVLWGILVGLAGAQQPITIITLPLFALSAFYFLEKAEGRFVRALVLCVSFSICFLGMYFSLIVANKLGSWPNWGNVSTLQSVFYHMFRLDYGTLHLSASRGQSVLTGLHTYGPAVLYYWDYLFALLVLGFWGWLERFGHPQFKKFHYCLLGALFLSIALLYKAEAHGHADIGTAVLDRFYGPITVLLGVVLAFGVEKIKKMIMDLSSIESTHFWIELGLSGLILGGFYFAGISYTRASHFNVAQVFREAIQYELEENTYYFSQSDLEAMYGILEKKGGQEKIRFPIEHGMYPNVWYRQWVLPSIEPRLASVNTSQHQTSTDLIRFLYDQGETVASDQPTLLWSVSKNAELRGLLFFIQSSTHQQFTQKTLEAAVRLCPFIEKLPAMPPTNLFHLNLYAHFARAYFGASEFLKDQNRFEEQAVAYYIYNALKKAEHPEEWNQGCQHLSGIVEGLLGNGAPSPKKGS